QRALDFRLEAVNGDGAVRQPDGQDGGSRHGQHDERPHDPAPPLRDASSHSQQPANPVPGTSHAERCPAPLCRLVLSYEPQVRRMPNNIAKPRQKVPIPGRPEAAAIGAGRWREAAEKLADSGVRRAARGLLDDARWGPLLMGIFGSSPFLTESLLSNVEAALDYAHSGPEAALARSLGPLGREGGLEAEPAMVERALRRAKQRVALLGALADLAGDWPLEKVTRALSDFAAHAVDIAVGLHAGRLARTGAVVLPRANTLEDSGIIVLGMGKLGAFELNYSSDVDLVVLYDP